MIVWLKRHSRLAAILAATALLVAAAAALMPDTTEGETAMSPKEPTPQVTTPPATTGVLETATFAMG